MTGEQLHTHLDEIEQVHGLYLYRVIYNLGTMNLSISASWFASATLIILALPLGLIFARIMTDKMFRYCTWDFLQTSHNRCCEFFLIAAVLLFVLQRQRVLACLMDHFLATAQHNAVHLLEMVQDVMLKLLKRQQNAQLIVIFPAACSRCPDRRIPSLSGTSAGFHF